MWHQHYIALRHVTFEHHDLMLALLAILDAASGFSRAIAERLKIVSGGQAILAWLLVIGFLLFNDLYTPDIGFWRDVEVRELGAMPEADMLGDILGYSRIMSMIACGLLARQTRRPVFLWLAAGYMGNAGAIVWLLVNRKQHEAVTA